MKKKIIIVFGTRPEAIKMAPVIHEFLRFPKEFVTTVCVTGQHRELLDQVMGVFGISPDFDLKIMKPGQDLSDITSDVLLGMREVMKDVKPDLVVVHGDTTTSAATALAAFYQQIPVAHIEAGLRTNNPYSPWPEEINRQLTGRLATWHFAPTLIARDNLLRENINIDHVLVTGNTVIDALKSVLRQFEVNPALKESVNNQIVKAKYSLSRLTDFRRLVMITGHRRENFGQGFENICLAIKRLTETYSDLDFIYPVHLNPNVRGPVHKILGNNRRENLFLIDPLEYLPFIYLMQNSYLILTDSGGIQEEAAELGKPVLVMRDTTERPEAINAGIAELVGTDSERIFSSVSRLILDKEYYKKMSSEQNPFGDGKASERIVNFLLNKLAD